VIISLIAAAAKNNAIGKDGDMPWRLSNDLKYFKNITWGLPVVMGRKTFESFGKGKPLPGRKNIILTRQKDLNPEGVVTVQSVEDAIFLVNEMDVKEMMVIGGGEIYRLFLEKANRIYLTRVDAEPEADTFFPEMDMKEWKLVSQKDHEADAKNDHNYSFQVWERIFK
jgi:dihydrofolate reductase